jgi:GT2 family glycosyltransferase
MVDISVVIVNWNVRDLLRKCLESIYARTKGIGFEVFVVDNNSSDASAEMARREFPQVKLIVNNENQGFATANNQALRKVEGRYSVLLNPDTQLIDNTFKAMVEFMDTHPEVCAIAPQLIFADGSLQHSCRHFPSFFTDLMESLFLDGMYPKNRIINWYKMGYWAHDQSRYVDVPYGACLLFETEKLKELGYFDERYFMYFEEIDLCYRSKKKFGPTLYLPQFKVIHHSNSSSRQISDLCHRWKVQSQIRFFAKHYGRLGIASLFFNLVLRTILVYVILSLAHLMIKRPRDLKYFKAVLKSIWKEYMGFIKEGKKSGK